MTYGGRGIAVQAICPQGVQTRMLEQAGPLKDLLSRDEALRRRSRWPTPGCRVAGGRPVPGRCRTPRSAGYYAARAADTDRWLAGMRKLQGKVDEYVGSLS